MTSDDSCKGNLQKCESVYSCQHPLDQACLPIASNQSWHVPANPAPLSEIEVLEFLHRGDESFVTLHRKIHDQWENLGAVAISEARDRVPVVREFLKIDSYFSINSTYPRKQTFKISALTGLPVYSRGEKYLRWLNALYVDLDTGHTADRFCFACLRKSLFAELARSGVPMPSILVSSGRGLWGLWRITDRRGSTTPIRAFPANIETYRRVERALATRFAGLGADLASVDAARVMRLPGTANSKASDSHRVVQFYKLSDESYPLPEFASAFGIDRRNSTVVPAVDRSSAKEQAKVNAALERWRRPQEGIERLCQIRHCFSKGVRRAAVYIYATLLRRNGFSEDEVLHRCRRMGAACKPKLDEWQIRRCVSSSKAVARVPFERSISNRTIAKKLRITETEKAALPEWFRSQASRADKIRSRQLLIKRELERQGSFVPDRQRWISARTMSRILLESHSLQVSHVTVLQDYRQLLAECFAVNEGSAVEPSGNFRGS